ncbi:UDP-glucose 4-epimerase [Dermacentor albipictus]|uniref:UDP-glucose 4-epimerase n=1 Tax=Dermacentor albipictus TaxID=60249 RepID=UPI0038FBFEAC
MTKGSIFVTGGAGYVGSHTVLELLNADYDVVVMDNYHNAHPDKQGKMPESLRRVQELTGKTVTFYKADLNDQDSIDNIFKKHHFDCVIHFAALKAVGESWQIPLDYYRTNLGGTVNLLDVMRSHDVKKIVFSSSCTVYGVPQYLPIDENHPTGQSCTNPYGRTKYFIEEMLKDLSASEKGWSIVLLRYFNPVGAHESGYIGEDPQGVPNNLMPYVSQVAIGRRPELSVFGNDFDTRDGTGVRDYVHVVDLAKGHVATLEKVMAGEIHGCKPFNLGTGQGSTVLEVIAAFEQASGTKIPYKIVDRRQGDVAELYAIPDRAEAELGWKAEKSLYDMCKDMWNWQKKNPNGFLETTN